jgi:hypothetical protein
MDNCYTELDSGEQSSLLLQLDWCSCVILFSWIYTADVFHDLVLYVISIMMVLLPVDKDPTTMCKTKTSRRS